MVCIQETHLPDTATTTSPSLDFGAMILTIGMPGDMGFLISQWNNGAITQKLENVRSFVARCP